VAEGSCLCGGVAWQVDGPLEWMTHCHCTMCRKAHGAAFATYVGAAEGGFRWLRGEEAINRYESSPGTFRAFCGRCGSVVPGPAVGGRVFVPAGCLDDDPGARPVAHIFAGSKAPWVEIADALPRFEAFPPGFPAPQVPPRSLAAPEPGVVRGSCLCGAVAYRLEGAPRLARNCHCSRCRKARAAAFASNLFAAAGDVRFVRGGERMRTYRVPDARFFTHAFCASCGGDLPRVDPERGIAVLPMGGLDDEPGLRPACHIFAGSKAPWFEIVDGIPQHRERPPEG
jgi:hypothetical protein